MLLMCSWTHYPAAESAPVCKYRRCVCVWSSLECVAAERKAGKLLRMAVPLLTCQHWQPGLWWWGGIMGVSAALSLSRMLGAGKLEGCPIPGSPGVCWSPLGPYNWHSAVCRIGLPLAAEKKTSLVQNFCMCKRPARKLLKLKWSHMSFSLGKESSKWEHVFSYWGWENVSLMFLGSSYWYKQGGSLLPTDFPHKSPTGSRGNLAAATLWLKSPL